MLWWESLFLEKGKVNEGSEEHAGPQEEAEAGTESRTELVKAGPGSPCWNRPGHPEAFKAAAWKVR